MIGSRGGKSRAAALSIASNSVLILLKIVAGVVTGSIAILTETVHSAIDLIASVIAFMSVRVADEPPDHTHPYGHEKFESLAALVEAVLIIVGAAIIVWEASRRLVGESHVELLGIGIAVMALSFIVNVVVSTYLYRRARETNSPALQADAAHLRTDAYTSLTVFTGLVLVEVTGEQSLDSMVAISVAIAIVVAATKILSTSSRVLVDSALPDEELSAVRDAIAFHGASEVIGFHKLRARGTASSRHIDLHVQFRDGTTLERAHEIAHELRDAIQLKVGGADVLIHLEPSSSSRWHEGLSD